MPSYPAVLKRSFMVHLSKFNSREKLLCVPELSVVALHVPERESCSLSRQDRPGIENKHHEDGSMAVCVASVVFSRLSHPLNVELRWSAWAKIKASERMGVGAARDYFLAGDIALTMPR